jgi:coiled-coil domain-containing protein 55
MRAAAISTVRIRVLQKTMADRSRDTFGLNAKPGLQMQIGQKGKTYGLVQAPRALAPSVFGAAALEEESAAEAVRRDALARASRADVQQLHNDALAADPTAFEYDGVYDEMKQQRANTADASRARDNTPRYIGSIIEAARQRVVDNDRVYERKLLKERDADAEMYEDKEKFVTGAYRAKLAERAAYDVDLRRQAEVESREDVTKRTDLTDFHRNLLFGNPGEAAKAAKSARVEDAVVVPPIPAQRATPTPRLAEHAPQPDPDAIDRGEAADSAQGPAPSAPAGERAVSATHPAPKRLASGAVASDTHPPAAKAMRRNDDAAVLSARERYLQRKATA